MVVTLDAVEVRMRMRVMMVAVARVRMGAVRVLVRCVLPLRRMLDSRRARLRVLAARRRPRIGTSGEQHAHDPQPAAQHRRPHQGFFFGGADAIFCLSAASSSSTVPPAWRARVAPDLLLLGVCFGCLLYTSDAADE